MTNQVVERPSREYEDADWPMVEDWWLEHHEGRPLARQILAPIGLVAYDEDGPAMVGFAYFIEERPVAILEYFIGRPGMTLAQANRTFSRLVRDLELVCLANGKIIVTAAVPATIARYAEKNHGYSDDGEFNILTKILPWAQE